MPRISVIVPVYKVENYIHQCVDSILGQTFRDFELILVDDGSPDGCPAICDAYAAQDSRVRVIHQKNGGLSAARNAGLDAASGEYVAFIDSDDWVDLDFLETMAGRVVQDDADMAICGVETAYNCEDGSIRHCNYTEIKNSVLSQDEMVELLATQSWYYIIICNKLFSRRLFDSIRFPEGFIHEDAAVIHRIFGECERIVMIEKGLYYYRQSDDSIMRAEFTIRRTDNLWALADRIKYSFDKKWIDLAEVTINRYVWMFFDCYFRFIRTEDNEKYFRRMDDSLKLALPYIMKSRKVSAMHKVYLCLIRVNPRIYTNLKKLFSKQ